MFSVFENVGMKHGHHAGGRHPPAVPVLRGSAMIGFMAAIGIVTSVHYRSTR